MTGDIYNSIKTKILDLRQSNPKHYVSMFKKRYPSYWNIIEEYNKKYFTEYTTFTSPQKIYNYVNELQSIPLCPISNKPVKFWDSKFIYRQYAVKGKLLPEIRSKAIVKLKTNYKSPTIPDFKNFNVENLTFDQLKTKYQKLIKGPRLSDKLNQLHFQPELSKQIYTFYNELEPMTACVWLLEHNMSYLPSNWEYYHAKRCCREKMSKNERSIANKNEKYNNAPIYDKYITINKLREYVKNLKDYHSFKPTMFKNDISLVKSIEEYTKELGDVKFVEKAYYLLHGKPENNDPDTNIVFTTFENGYEMRSIFSFESGGEAELKNWLRSLNIDVQKYNDSTFEIDAYISNKNIGIEYDGIYYHSNYFKDKNYHINKTNYFKNKNIKLFHIFDIEWMQKKELVKSIISSKLGIFNKKIFARKCIIKEVDKITKKQFLNDNHIQGDCLSKFNIGLFYDNELVSIMTFGSRQISKKSQFELLRFCNLKNTCVIGAASKLFTYFTKTHQDIEHIKTYADLRFYNDSGFYEKLGFTKINQTKPNYYYFKCSNPNKVELLSRIQFQKHKLKNKLEKFDPNLTEEQNMLNNGYYKIYDCGNYVFEWYKK